MIPPSPVVAAADPRGAPAEALQDRSVRQDGRMSAWSAPVRYAECDMQGIVFNAHYLLYADEALTGLLRGLGFERVTVRFAPPAV